MEALLERIGISSLERNRQQKVYIPLSPESVELHMSVRINQEFEGQVDHTFDNGRFINVSPYADQNISSRRMVLPGIDLIEQIIRR